MALPADIAAAVLSGAGAAAITSSVTLFMERRRTMTQLRDHFDGKFAEQNEALQANTTGVAVLVSQLTPMQRVQDENVRRIGTLSEAVSVLTTNLEQHQRWIELRDREAYEAARRMPPRGGE